MQEGKTHLNLREFLIENLGEIAKERAFDGESTEGIQEARECVGKTFDTLQERYGIIKKQVVQNSK